MPAKGKVSLKWQIVMVLFPILQCYAFYRIKKLRLGLVVAVTFGGTQKLIDYVYGVPFGFGSALEGNLFPPAPDWGYFILYYVVLFSWFVFDVILILSWSKEWNNKFELN